MYGARGVPSLEEVRFSITSHRGCFGGCSFCAITLHQGRLIQRRSADSVVREAEAMTHDPDFKGYIHLGVSPRQDGTKQHVQFFTLYRRCDFVVVPKFHSKRIETAQFIHRDRQRRSMIQHGLAQRSEIVGAERKCRRPAAYPAAQLNRRFSQSPIDLSVERKVGCPRHCSALSPA
jgi:hypothetical protein